MFKMLTTFELDYEDAKADGEYNLLKRLRKQIRDSIRKENLKNSESRRSVYIIRLVGSFLIAYPNANSPVLYIGRGDVNKRLASHLNKWMHHVPNFGKDTSVEVRILLPRRRHLGDYYKYVEGQLIAKHEERCGCVPMFNSKHETAFAKDIDYSQSEHAQMRALVGIGSGKRPWWALKPTSASPFKGVYDKGLAVHLTSK